MTASLAAAHSRYTLSASPSKECRMTTTLRTCLVLLAAVTVAPATATAQTSWSNCRTDQLSNYNCASYYSGTVSLTSQLKGSGVNEAWSIVATVTAGSVSCTVKQPDMAEYSGPGMLAVEHSTNANSGEYEINVWCPEAEGERVTRDDSPMIVVMDQQSSDYRTLMGRDEHENPSADAVNGLTGTETITWSLRRS
jgi:hypothetical protein